MSYGMRIVGLTGHAVHGGDQVPEGFWVSSYDPEANDGQGDVSWTADPAAALRFDRAGDAMVAWRAVPTARPVRPDGLPNRPLTAFTVEILEIPA